MPQVSIPPSPVDPPSCLTLPFPHRNPTRSRDCTASAWQDLQVSIRTILSFSLLNMPMVGADICGTRPPTGYYWWNSGSRA